MDINCTCNFNKFMANFFFFKFVSCVLEQSLESDCSLLSLQAVSCRASARASGEATRRVDRGTSPLRR